MGQGTGRTATPAERITANVETWRILNGTTLPFDADAASRHVEASIASARDIGRLDERTRTR